MNKVKIFQNAQHIKDCYPAEARKMIKAGLAEKLILDGEFCIKLIENKEEKMSEDKKELNENEAKGIIELQEDRIVLNMKYQAPMDIIIHLRDKYQIIKTTDGENDCSCKALDKMPLVQGKFEIETENGKISNKYSVNDLVTIKGGNEVLEIKKVVITDSGFRYEVHCENRTLVFDECDLLLYKITHIYDKESFFKLYDTVRFESNRLTKARKEGIVIGGQGKALVKVWCEEMSKVYEVEHKDVGLVL